MQGANDTRATKAARLAVAETARVIRARLRASRRPVDPQVDEYAGRRRGVRTADGLRFLAATMIGGGYSAAEAKEMGALLFGAVVDAIASDDAPRAA
jgi:hypothetical protein